MKLIIAGGRDFSNYELLCSVMAKVKTPITEIVSGTATGADSLGARWAREHNIPVKEFPADWDNLTRPGAIVRTRRDGKKYDARAGHFRNEQMAQYADAVIAFWDGKSAGTKNMIETAEAYDLKCFTVRY